MAATTVASVASLSSTRRAAAPRMPSWRSSRSSSCSRSRARHQRAASIITAQVRRGSCPSSRLRTASARNIGRLWPFPDRRFRAALCGLLDESECAHGQPRRVPPLRAPQRLSGRRQLLQEGEAALLEAAKRQIDVLNARYGASASSFFIAIASGIPARGDGWEWERKAASSPSSTPAAGATNTASRCARRPVGADVGEICHHAGFGIRSCRWKWAASRRNARTPPQPPAIRCRARTRHEGYGVLQPRSASTRQRQTGRHSRKCSPATWASTRTPPRCPTSIRTCFMKAACRQGYLRCRRVRRGAREPRAGEHVV